MKCKISWRVYQGLAQDAVMSCTEPLVAVAKVASPHFFYHLLQDFHRIEKVEGFWKAFGWRFFSRCFLGGCEGLNCRVSWRFSSVWRRTR